MSTPLTPEDARWVVEHPAEATSDDLAALTAWADANPELLAALVETQGDAGVEGARALPDVIDPAEHLARVEEQQGERGLASTPLRAPASLGGLRDALLEARAAGRPVRVLGSFRSQSDVAVPEVPTDDALFVATSFLVDVVPDAAHGEVYVQAGANVGRLNDALDAAGLALPNMGSGDFQTIVGALSTGTHGSGYAIGDIASLVIAVELLTLDATGAPVLYKLSAAGSTVHSPGYAGNEVRVEALADDDAFNAARISLGCLGIVFAVTLKVMPTYFLGEDRVPHPWADLATLVAEANQPRHFEILFSPLADPAEALLVTERTLVDGPNLVKRPAGLVLAADRIGTVMGHERLGQMIARPDKVPGLLQSAINCSQVRNFRRKSFKVLKLGLKVDARAPEIGVPAARAVQAAMDLRALVAARFAKSKVQPMAFWRDHAVSTSPISMRWVARSSTLLSMQYAPAAELGGEPWVMFEAPMLVDPVRAADPTDTAYAAYDQGRRGLVRAIEDLLCGQHGGRAHWGLESSSGPDQVAAQWGAAWATWKAQRKRFDPFDLYRGAFTRRMGLTP